MNLDSRFAVFGFPDSELAALPKGATQLSPLVPASLALEDAAPGSLTGIIMAAPPGTLERNFVLALSLRALQAGASFTVMAPKDKGGSRIARELESFGCTVQASSRRHQRICQTVCPATFDAQAQAHIDAAIAAGGLRFVDAVNAWSQPGIFSWDRIDPGSALLLSVLPSFMGRGADLGCGLGLIARAVLANVNVTHLDLVDIDRRAIAAARKNVIAPRATFHWADVRTGAGLRDLDFVVTNPPFHDGGREDKALGQAFVRQCHHLLRDGGKAWIVANVHLPYESALHACFSNVALRAQNGGYKVYEATR